MRRKIGEFAMFSSLTVKLSSLLVIFFLILYRIVRLSILVGRFFV